NQRAVSPILATVLLLGITVVGGGLAYSLMAQGSSAASTQTIITLENAQAVKGTSHSDVTATIKNGGSVPWKQLEMTVAKGELSEPILYEALHENVAGCSVAMTSGACTGGTAADLTLDNPLRAQWLASLNTGGETTKVVDNGEGIAAGRKFVVSTSDPSLRSVQILNGTWIAKAFGDTTLTDVTNKLKNSAGTTVSCDATTTTWTDCGQVFKALDAATVIGNSNGDGIECHKDPNLNDAIECKVFTHYKIAAPIQPGSSFQIYADAFTADVPGLKNLKVQSGDGLVVNIVAIGENGSTARYQTIIKVVGI
ncbi:MAG: archaellin/type IV pilin N-terminal domain-containing protein, partial [Nitrososphaerota archaeon]